MAHSVSITDGTNTLSLSTSNIFLLQYVPRTPDISTISRNSLGDGRPVDMPSYENVTEAIEIMFYNTSKTDLQAQITALNRYLLLAKRRQQTKTGTRVYLQLQVDGESDTWRSEIFTGRLELDNDALRHYANIKVGAALIVERAFYWEGPETELAIKTSNTSAATGGRTIYNHDDSTAGHDNWVQMASTQVEGDLPTPAKITLQNITGSAQGYRNFHIAVNAYSDPSLFTHIIEGEDASSGGTTVASGTSSGGNTRNITVNTTGSMQWALAGSQLQKTDGRHFRLLCRLASVTGTGVYIQAQVREKYGNTPLYYGDEVFVDDPINFLDLGVFPLPPSRGNVSWDDMVLHFSLRSSSSTTISFDFIQLTPLDSYAKISQLGNQLANNETITIDPIEQAIYASDAGPIYASSQPWAYLYPNQLQRIIFLVDDDLGTPDVDDTMEIRVYARSRRLTI